VQDKKWVTRGLRRLGGKVVIVLATGPKGCGFKPSRGDGFLRTIKIRSTPSFRWEIKPEAPCRTILRHVKITCKYQQKYFKDKFSLLSSIPPTCCQATLLIGLPESYDGRVRSFPCRNHHLDMVLFAMRDDEQ
jgi:hypothetical protein